MGTKSTIAWDCWRRYYMCNFIFQRDYWAKQWRHTAKRRSTLFSTPLHSQEGAKKTAEEMSKGHIVAPATVASKNDGLIQKSTELQSAANIEDRQFHDGDRTAASKYELMEKAFQNLFSLLSAAYQELAHLHRLVAPTDASAPTDAADDLDFNPQDRYFDENDENVNPNGRRSELAEIETIALRSLFDDKNNN